MGIKKERISESIIVIGKVNPNIFQNRNEEKPKTIGFQIETSIPISILEINEKMNKEKRKKQKELKKLRKNKRMDK